MKKRTGELARKRREFTYGSEKYLANSSLDASFQRVLEEAWKCRKDGNERPTR
jgi:hypothetical protein